MSNLDWLIASERARLAEGGAPGPAQPATVPHTKLPEEEPKDSAARDWNCYLRGIGRLLAEGHAGRWVVIHDAAIVGIWETEKEARAIAAARFLMRPVLIHQVQEREPILPAPTFLLRCRT